ncbi:MAG: lysine--tRNA ligase [Candidatus Vogelbacteria bacterium]|nr:lysine--tRNA ligase [Candidatus Vogelbacteria bacterium]
MASLDDIRSERLKKLELLKQANQNPFPIHCERSHSLKEVGSEFDPLSEAKTEVKLVGRLMARRGQGALIFFDLFDGTGKFQAVAKKDTLGEDSLGLFDTTVDVGDFVAVTGTLFTTKQGEKTLEVTSWQMLAKSLRPLPDKWAGLQDVEERFRKRYLDTLTDETVRTRFITRSKIITEIRNFLNSDGFLEVETSMLQQLAGGATATPFVTHHEALDIDLSLRVAPELDLKKMMIGGFPMIYEIGRSFRNEGIDPTHNPEFTSLEAYAAFSDATAERARVEKLFKQVIQKVFGSDILTYDGQTISFAEPFAVVKYLDLIKEYTGLDNVMDMSEGDLLKEATKLGLSIDPNLPKEKIIDHIYKKACRPKVIQPTFLVDYPVEFAPLAKRREDDPRLIDRFQLLVGGTELVNGFSELNDPIDQRARFMEQEKNKAKGDNEAQPKDEDFLEAMEYGMPPACGWGIGIDRLVMLLTDVQTIKEVIYFPTLRPKGE